MTGKREIPTGILLSAGALLLWTLTCRQVSGQDQGRENSFPEPEIFKESLALFTDRSTYIAGEKIWFTVFNCSPQGLREVEWSKIVCVELMSAGNEPVIQEKVRLSPDGASGSLDISRSPVSGVYYLRAYTRWMRNFPVEDYAYRRIRIINPRNPEISGNGEEDQREGFVPLHPSSGSVEVIQADMHSDRGNYGNREKVEVSGSIPLSRVDDLSGLCLTVVRKTAIDSLDDMAFFPTGPEENESVFVPETRGMAVVGRVVDKTMGTPVPNARVHLSMIGEEPDYRGYQTGADGKFYIPLKDYTGDRDFYIGAETDLEDETEILIDQDFSTGQIVFRRDKFIILDEERPVLEEMMINAQVSNIFGSTLPEKDTSAEIVKVPDELNFYSEPWFKLRIDDYVKLPSVEEFIFELVPQATIHRRRGKPQMRILGEYGNQLIYEPLILLDHVAISDVNTILPISPEKIESIELINATYIHGSINYGGILSINSKNHDLAGVDLPGSSYFFGFRTLAEPCETAFPEYGADKGDRRRPDFRNCLYWEPDLQVDESGRFHGQFYTSDRNGEYIVVVRGSTYKGEEIYGSTVIRVD